MKKRKLFLQIMFLMTMLLSVSFNANAAYDFEVDGIYYNILSSDDRTVEVTNADGGTESESGRNSYSGDVIIPQEVLYGDVTYAVTTIGERAFLRCSSLLSVEIPSSVTTIRYCGFDNCSLTSVELPSVTTIGKMAFCYCEGLVSVKAPNVITIGQEAFSGCYSLVSIEMGSSITEIGEDAFYECINLTSVEIPYSVTIIGGGAFDGCESLIEIYCKPTIPPSYLNESYADDMFSEKTYQNGTLYVPVGSKGDYEVADPWCNFCNIEELDFSGVENVIAESDDITVTTIGGTIVVGGLEAGSIVEVYSINGQRAYHGTDNVIGNFGRGAYIVKAGSKTFKILL